MSIRIVEMPDIGVVTDASSVVAEKAGSGRFTMPAVRTYLETTGKLGDMLSVVDFGAIGDGVANDTVAIQAAMDAGAERGGSRILFPPGTYRITGSLHIGNGTASAVSTKQGVVLVGQGAPAITGFFTGYPLQPSARIVWDGPSDTMIRVNGPIQGWGVQGLALDGGSVANEGIGVTSGQFGDCQNLLILGCRLQAIGSTTVAPFSGVSNTDSIHNSWRNICISCPAVAGVKGIVLTGIGPAVSSDTDLNMFENIMIGLPASGAAFGVYLQNCDTNQFIGLHIAGGSAAATGIMFDYSAITGGIWPSGNSFFGLETNGAMLGANQFVNAGTPSINARPNFVRGMAPANSGTNPAIANLLPDLPVVVPPNVYRRDQSGAVGPLPLITPYEDGIYRVSLYLAIQALGDAQTVTLSIGWNDGAARTYSTAPLNMSTGANNPQAITLTMISVANLAMNYNVAVSGSLGAGRYQMAIVAERICLSDTADALQKALAPKTGMRRIPFPLESYQHPSLPLQSKRLINLMAEQQPADSRTVAALVSTPGLLAWTVAAGGTGPIGTGPILSMNDDAPGRVYVVSGTRAYRLYFPLLGGVVVDDLGDVGVADSGAGSWNTFVTIAAGPTAVVICVPPRAYTCGHNPGETLNEIGGDVFEGATSVCYIDGYFAFSAMGNTAEWFISRLLDPTDFDALDFVFSDAVPNAIRRVIGHRGQVWTIGENGFEVWYNAGTADFPFRRMSGGVVPVGTNSPMSVCRAQNSVFWLGADGIAYRSEGYNPVRISTHAIEAILGVNAIGLVALTHPYRGHWFYALTTQDQSRTLVFDVATGVWHERATSTDGTGPWRVSVASVDNNSINLFGDRAGNVLYTLGMQAADAGVTVLRQMTLPPLWAETRRAYCARLEIEMEVGGTDTPGALQLEWSDDGSRTWGPTRTLSSGTTTELRHRVFTTRLGSFRQRTFRLSSHGLTRLYAVDADIQAGSH